MHEKPLSAQQALRLRIECERRLERFAPGWSSFLPCPGWFDLLLELDGSLFALEPDYELYQVKERMGGLRYYAAPPGRQVPLRLDVLGVGSYAFADRDRFQTLIHEAEQASFRICEVWDARGNFGATGAGSTPSATRHAADPRSAWRSRSTTTPDATRHRFD